MGHMPVPTLQARLEAELSMNGMGCSTNATMRQERTYTREYI
jgi:hypothetical protein